MAATDIMTQGKKLAAIMVDYDKGPEYALVQCIGDDFACTAERRVEGSKSMTDQQIIDLLAEEGWSVGSTLCPEHRQNLEQSAVPENNL